MNVKPQPAWIEPLLAALAVVPVLQYACKAAGVERTVVWKRRQTDKAFAAAYDEFMEAGVDVAEAEAFRRAVQGFEEPVVHKGELCYRHEEYTEEATGERRWRISRDDHGDPVPLTVRKHSDTLLSMILKGRRKKVYAERTEITGADGGDLKIDNPTARAARVAALFDTAKRRAAAGPASDDFSDLV